MIHTPAIQKFRSSKPLCDALAAALSNDALTQALALLRDAALPKHIPASIPGNHPDTAIAHEYYRKNGIIETLDSLRAMAEFKAAGASTDDDGEDNREFVPDDYRKAPPKIKRP